MCLEWIVSYLSQSCTCRQTWSTRSGRSLPPERPGAQASAGWQTGWPSRWGRTGWRSRRAGLRRRTWACWLSSCHTGQWWHTHPWRTGSKLSERKDKGHMDKVSLWPNWRNLFKRGKIYDVIDGKRRIFNSEKTHQCRKLVQFNTIKLTNDTYTQCRLWTTSYGFTFSGEAWICWIILIFHYRKFNRFDFHLFSSYFVYTMITFNTQM